MNDSVMIGDFGKNTGNYTTGCEGGKKAKQILKLRHGNRQKNLDKRILPT